MKKCAGWILLLCYAGICKGQVKWDGGASTSSWNDAANWMPDLVPSVNDDVILDHSFVPGAYTVLLPAGAVSTSVRSIRISPAGGDSISLWLPVSNTADPGLQLTGPGDALVLDARARLVNASGAASGTGISILNTFRINNGGHYLHRTSRSNAGIISQLSVATGTETGVIEFDTPGGSYTLSLSNRVFGSLWLSATQAGGSKTYLGSGANPCTVRGDFVIRSGVTCNLGMSATGHFITAGNLATETGSVLNLQSGASQNRLKLGGHCIHQGTITETGTGQPVLEFNGTAPQQYTGNGSIQQSVSIQVNNGLGLQLLSALDIPFQLILGNGKISSSSAALLSLQDNAVITGAHAGSFVDGPMRKTGDEDFVFPLGKGGIYAPLGLEGGTAAQVTDQFTAEYHRVNPQSVYGHNYAPGIDHISFVEYWTVAATGTSSRHLWLDARETSFCRVPSTSFVCRWNGSAWQTEASTALGFAPCGAYQCGRLLTQQPQSSFQVFTIGTSDPFQVNPLPVSLLEFRIISPNGAWPVRLAWRIAEDPGPGRQFLLERTTDGQRYTTLRQRRSATGTLYYMETDTAPLPGLNMYRLKIIEPGADTVYSPLIRLRWPYQPLRILQVIPQPVTSRCQLWVLSDIDGPAGIELSDLTGRIYWQQRWLLEKGRQKRELDLAYLPAGVYRVRIFRDGRETSILLLKR